MGRITAIRLDKKRKTRPGLERFHVELDGRGWAVLDAETILTERLNKGLDLGAERREEILLADEILRARRAAATRLALKPRSRAELEIHLKQRRFRLEAIDPALDRLESAGLIDDDEVAARWIRGRLREGGWGEARLRHELRGRGIDEATIDRQIAVYRDRLDPAEQCRALIEKKIKPYRPLDRRNNRRRLQALLRRRGFDPETITRCLRCFENEETA